MTETTFTPLAGLIGGALIGLASAGLLLADGKIAGISGILGRSFFPAAGDLGWRLAFLVGLPVGAWLATLTPRPKYMVCTPQEEAAVWHVRESALGAVAVQPGKRQVW